MIIFAKTTEFIHFFIFIFMKRLLSIIACLALTASVVSAQDEYRHWFMQLQGGVAHTVGETTWTDLLSPAGAISLGYQFSPVFAARLNATGWQAKGALTGPVQVYKYNYVQGGVDLMADLCNLFGNNKIDRTLSPYLFIGAAANYAFNNDEANAVKANFPADNYLWDGSYLGPVGRAGLGLNIRLSDAIDLNLEANGNATSDHFNSKIGENPDFQFNALAGLTIHFGRGKAAPVAVAPVEPVKPAPAPAAEPARKPEPKPEPKPVVEKKPVEVAPAFESLTENVYFIIDKWDIRASEQAKIDKIVEVMNANPGVKINIQGHADKDTGTASRNRFLSEKRCQEVAKALQAAGIAKDRITTEFFGDNANPFNTPEENRVAVCIVK